MSAILLYLLKLSISLDIIWTFYQLMLRRLTFYNLNRWYLLGYSLLCFVIPFINIGSLLEKESFQGSAVVQYIPVIGDFKEAAPDPGIFSRVSPWHILSGILILGSVVLLIRLAIHWLSLRQIRRKARLITGTGVKIFQVDESILPFSFGNAIYINPQLHTEKEYSAIILHEYVHIRQKHTVDILLAELICIVNWYNPFAWLIRYSIRQNLEFIADRKVLENGLDKKGYQYHLLQVVGAPAYRLANNFKFSSLKKRIIMMNKIKSAKLHLIKFLFIVPLLATLLLAFRDKIGSVKGGGGPVTAAAKVIGSDTVIFNGDVMIDNNLYSFKDLKLAFNDSPKTALEPVVAAVAATVPVRSTDTVPKKTDSAKPLFIVNGVQMPENWNMDSLSRKDIISVEVIGKREGDVRRYGPGAANGVVEVTLRALRPTGDTTSHLYDPLYYIDGVEASRQQMKELDPHDIESINICKGDSAVLKYGEKGRNGVVLIHMKPKGASMEQRIRVRDEQKMMEDQRKLVEAQVVQQKELQKRIEDQRKTDKQQRTITIMDNKTGEKMTGQADSIIWKKRKDDTKEYVGFVNGVRAPKDVSVESLIARQDTQAIESISNKDILAKYGFAADQAIVNIITRENKDNPAAYMLGGH